MNPWDLIAAKYDKEFGDEGDYSHKYIIYPSLIKELGENNLKGKKVLDLGCGTGTLTRKLSTLNAEAIGIDFSEEMITYAKIRDTTDTITYKLLDIRNDLPFKDESFDMVFQIMVLHSIEDQFINNIASETNRILKSKGECIVVIPHPFFVKDFKSIEYPDKDIYLSHYQSEFTWKQFNEVCNSPTLFNLRPLEFYVNAFCEVGFSIRKLLEPKIINSQEAIEAKPYNFERRKEIPGFMLIKFVKL